jgi:hypothetical protein
MKSYAKEEDCDDTRNVWFVGEKLLHRLWPLILVLNKAVYKTTTPSPQPYG